MITRLRIAGMSSQYCVQAVFTSLTPVPGILATDVSIGTVVVEHDGQATLQRLREAIAVSGYEVLLATEEPRRLPVL